MKKGLIIALALVSFGTMAQSTDGMTAVFEDGFTNNVNAWLLEETGRETSWINYNENRLVLEADGGGRVTMTAPSGFNGDFVIKGNVWCKECSGEDNASFGLIFGYSTFGNKATEGWYQIRLTQDGGDGVWIKANNANGSTLYEQTVRAAFDPDDANEIAVQRSGETVTFYLNGTEVYSNVSTETIGNKISFIGSGTKCFMSSLSMFN